MTKQLSQQTTTHTHLTVLSVSATVINFQQLCKTQSELIVHAVADKCISTSYVSDVQHRLRIQIFTNFKYLYL